LLANVPKQVVLEGMVIVLVALTSRSVYDVSLTGCCFSVWSLITLENPVARHDLLFHHILKVIVVVSILIVIIVFLLDFNSVLVTNLRQHI